MEKYEARMPLCGWIFTLACVRKWCTIVCVRILRYIDLINYVDTISSHLHLCKLFAACFLGINYHQLPYNIVFAEYVYKFILKYVV